MNLLVVTIAALLVFHNCCFAKILILGMEERKNYSDFLTLFDFEEVEYYPGSDLKLVAFGEPLYSTIIFFQYNITKKQIGHILSFLDHNGNVMLVTNRPNLATRMLTNQFGLTFVDSNTKLVDMFDNSTKTNTIETVGKEIFYIDNVEFEGIPHIINSEIGKSVLMASRTSICLNNDTNDVVLYGNENSLISIIQTKKNARISVIGSTSMMTNNAFQTNKNNKKLMEKLVKWTSNRLHKVEIVSHSHTKNNIVPEYYIVNDIMEYTLRIREINNKGEITPFIQKMYLEINMLDTYIRKKLELNHTTQTEAVYKTSIRMPDKYGTFKIEFKLNRLPYSFVEIIDVIPIVPLKHDMFKRFIPNAYPYYMASVINLLGFLVFSTIFLMLKEQKIKSN